MTKICFLHLGFHKTATTSIQLTCRNNSNLLRKNGIETPKFLNEKNKISANHTRQLRDIFAPSNKKLYNKIKRDHRKPGQNSSLEGTIFEFLRLLHSNFEPENFKNIVLNLSKERSRSHLKIIKLWEKC